MHLVSWWVLERASPPSEASGSRDYMTLNTKVGMQFFLSFESLLPLTQMTNGASLLFDKLVNVIRRGGMRACWMESSVGSES